LRLCRACKTTNVNEQFAYEKANIDNEMNLKIHLWQQNVINIQPDVWAVYPDDF
jgi:hypothetical protein